MDNIKTWTGLSVEESIRMTEDRDKWRKYSMVWPTLGSKMAKEQNRTSQKHTCRRQRSRWCFRHDVNKAQSPLLSLLGLLLLLLVSSLSIFSFLPFLHLSVFFSIRMTEDRDKW